MRHNITTPALTILTFLAGCAPQHQVDWDALNAQAMERLQTATNNAKIKCANKNQCDKLWALTQVYISNNSGMKIQLANDSLIQTYNPVQPESYSLNATKAPNAGESATISLTYQCVGLGYGYLQEMQSVCTSKGVELLNGYAREMKASLKN